MIRNPLLPEKRPKDNPENKDDENYIDITSNKKSGCWSSIGMVGGRQELSLEKNGCMDNHATPLHEFMHALGFHHEQNRPDRFTADCV